MNKEKMVHLLSEALEKNVSISLHFSQFQGEKRQPVTRQEAEELVTRYAEALEITDIQNETGRPYADGFTIDDKGFRVTHSYIPGTEEKIAGKRKRIEELKKELALLKEDKEVVNQ